MTLSEIALYSIIALVILIALNVLMNVLAWLMVKVGHDRYKKEIRRLRDGMPKGQHFVMHKDGERIFFVSKNKSSMRRNLKCSSASLPIC